MCSSRPACSITALVFATVYFLAIVGSALAQQPKDTAIAEYLRANAILDRLTDSEWRHVETYAMSWAVQEDPLLVTSLNKSFSARSAIIRGTGKDELDSMATRGLFGMTEYSDRHFDPNMHTRRLLFVLGAHARWAAENGDLPGALMSIDSGYKLLAQLSSAGRISETIAVQGMLRFWLRMVHQMFEAGVILPSSASFILKSSQQLDSADPVGIVSGHIDFFRIGAAQRIAVLEQGGMDGLLATFGRHLTKQQREHTEITRGNALATLANVDPILEQWMIMVSEEDDIQQVKNSVVELIRGTVLPLCFIQFQRLDDVRLQRIAFADLYKEHQSFLSAMSEGLIAGNDLLNGAILYLRAGAAWRALPEELRHLDWSTVNNEVQLKDSFDDEVWSQFWKTYQLLEEAVSIDQIDFTRLYDGVEVEHVHPINREILALHDAIHAGLQRMSNRVKQGRTNTELASLLRYIAMMSQCARHIGLEPSWLSSAVAAKLFNSSLDIAIDTMNAPDISAKHCAGILEVIEEVQASQDWFHEKQSHRNSQAELEVFLAGIHGKTREMEWRATLRERLAECDGWHVFVYRLLAESGIPNGQTEHIAWLDRSLGTEFATIISDGIHEPLKQQAALGTLRTADIERAFGSMGLRVDQVGAEQRIERLLNAISVKIDQAR